MRPLTDQEKETCVLIGKLEAENKELKEQLFKLDNAVGHFALTKTTESMHKMFAVIDEMEIQ